MDLKEITQTNIKSFSSFMNWAVGEGDFNLAKNLADSIKYLILKLEEYEEVVINKNLSFPRIADEILFKSPEEAKQELVRLEMAYEKWKTKT